jgi:NADH:ubiquinone oxidoreductase subunit C
LGPLIKQIKVINTDIEIKTTPNNLRSLLSFLKKDSLTQYKQLSDIVCSDIPTEKYRFSLTYILFSIIYSARIRITIQTNEVIPVPSVIRLFESAG